MKTFIIEIELNRKDIYIVIKAEDKTDAIMQAEEMLDNARDNFQIKEWV